MTRQMAMVGFLQAQNCTNLPSSWRHPDSRDHDHDLAEHKASSSRSHRRAAASRVSNGTIRSAGMAYWPRSEVRSQPAATSCRRWW